MPSETPKIEIPQKDKEFKDEKSVEAEDLARLEEKAKKQAGLILKLIAEFKNSYEKKEFRALKELFEGVFQNFRKQENEPFLKDYEELKMNKTEKKVEKVEAEAPKTQDAKGEPKEISLGEALAIMEKVKEEIKAECREFGWDEEELKEKSWP